MAGIWPTPGLHMPLQERVFCAGRSCGGELVDADEEGWQLSGPGGTMPAWRRLTIARSPDRPGKARKRSTVTRPGNTREVLRTAFGSLGRDLPGDPGDG